MSAWPVASHTRTSLDSPIISAPDGHDPPKAAGSTSGATTSRTPLGRIISTINGTPFALGTSSTQTRTIAAARWQADPAGRAVTPPGEQLPRRNPVTPRRRRSQARTRQAFGHDPQLLLVGPTPPPPRLDDRQFFDTVCMTIHTHSVLQSRPPNQRRSVRMRTLRVARAHLKLQRSRVRRVASLCGGQCHRIKARIMQPRLADVA